MGLLLPLEPANAHMNRPHLFATWPCVRLLHRNLSDALPSPHAHPGTKSLGIESHWQDMSQYAWGGACVELCSRECGCHGSAGQWRRLQMLRSVDGAITRDCRITESAGSLP
jgi:hypothetical protein